MQKRHHPLPAIWLMTDERLGDGLLHAIAGLPRGAGIIFRHYATPPKARRQLFEKVRRAARRSGHVLVLAGTPRHARGWRAAGAHGRAKGTLTAPAHNLREVRAAERRGAKLAFVSPVFPTRSHPGAPVLGRVRFLDLVRQARCPVIALGGMTKARFARLKRGKIYGWAAIDGLSGKRA
ncbi:MAG: thiamine phosphate synthase [Chakrabartia sp.]